MIVGFLVNGAIQALVPVVIAFLLSRFVGDFVGRSVLAIFLIMAAGSYQGFAIMASDLLGAGPIWAPIELVGGVVFGTMALLGLRGSPWWLAAGWALHPIWDVALHYFGPGGSFAPESYAIACVSYDLLVAGYIAVVYGLGLLSTGVDRRSDKASIKAESPRYGLAEWPQQD
jgi:hypothetical protein